MCPFSPFYLAIVWPNWIIIIFFFNLSVAKYLFLDLKMLPGALWNSSSPHFSELHLSTCPHLKNLTQQDRNPDFFDFCWGRLWYSSSVSLKGNLTVSEKHQICDSSTSLTFYHKYSVTFNCISMWLPWLHFLCYAMFVLCALFYLEE